MNQNTISKQIPVRYLWIVGFLFVAIIISSCHRKVNVQHVSETKADKAKGAFVETLEKSKTPFKWLRIKAKVRYQGKGNDYTAGLLMKMRQDSIIWGVANVVLEVGRLLINKDSASILIGIKGQYAIYTLPELQQSLGLQNLAICPMQDLILAYPPFTIGSDYNFVIKDNTYHLYRTTAMGKEDMIIDATNMRIKEFDFKRNESNKVHITYESWEMVNGNAMPKKIIINAHAPDETIITFDINSYTLSDDESVRFNIPSGYEKMH